MTLLTQIALARTIVLTIIRAELITPVPAIIVMIVYHLTTSLVAVAAALHATPSNYTPIAVIGPHVPLPAIIAMILLREALERVV